MLMSNCLLAFLLLLLANIVHSFEYRRLVREIRNHSAPFTVSVKDQFWHGWIECETEPRIVLKSSGFSKPCKVPIIYENGCGENLASSSLGNGKVLVWMKDHNEDKACWRLYFIDPSTCEYDAYRLDVYQDGPIDNLVTYNDEIEAFFASGPLCPEKKVCGLRFDDKGIMVRNVTLPDDGSDRYWLQRMTINDTEGYFYATESSKVSTIKLLDSNLTEVYKFNFNYSLDGLSVSHGRILLCNIRSATHLHCEKSIADPKQWDIFKKVQSEFKSEAEATNIIKWMYQVRSPEVVSEIYNTQTIRKIKVFNLREGGYVVMAISDDKSFPIIHVGDTLSLGQSLDINEYLTFDSPHIEHTSIGNGTECVTSWARSTGKIVTKCIERVDDNYLTRTIEIN